MKNRDLKISFILNIIIVLFTIFATYSMFTGLHFTKGQDLVLEAGKLGMFQYFTVDSNLFMGIISLLFTYYEYLVLSNKKKEIPKFAYILKLMSTTSVVLTFLVVFLYLGPISKGGIMSMLQNANLFYHGIVPMLSIITFIFFEKTNKIIFKDTFLALLPMGIYGLFYLTNIIIHMENGKVSPFYDWYWFVQNGVWTIVIVLPVMFGFTYLIGFILYRINHIKK